MATQDAHEELLTTEQIATLAQFAPEGAKVMSVYLNVPPERHVGGALSTALKELIQSLPLHGDSVGEHSLATLRSEAAPIERMLERPRGKGLVAFSCAAHGFWRAAYLPVPVADYIAYERWPDVGPLISVLDDYKRYVVALVDKARARLFSMHLGAIEEHQQFFEDIPQKHDQGGMSQARLQRNHEEHVHWHLKEVVERLEDLSRERPFDRLVLAGPVEAVSELRDLLPRALADRLIAVTNLEFIANEDEVLARTLEIEQRAEREAEQRVVEQLADAEAQQRGARGVAPTLEALYLGNVMTLVVAEGFRVPGVECPRCGRLDRLPVDACPACGGRMQPTHDIVHRAMARTLAQGGAVDVVHDGAAQGMADHEGIGAIFRFTNPLATTPAP